MENNNKSIVPKLLFTGVLACFTAPLTMASQEFETPFKIIEPELLNRYQTLYKNRTTGAEYSPVTGTVTFAVTDINIPGNFDIPVELKRWVPQSDIRVGGFDSPASIFSSVSWSWDIPVVKMNYMGDHTSVHSGAFNGIVDMGTGGVVHGENCSGTVSTRVHVANNDNTHGVPHYTYWEGKELHIPGKTTEKFLEQDQADGSIKQVTKSNYVVDRCFTISGTNQEGMVVKGPDGTSYTFGKVKTYYTGAPAPRQDSPLTAFTKLLLVTEIEDRFGNTVTYDYYNHGHLRSITSSDNRSINITYTTNTFKGRVYYLADKATTDSGKEWTYGYTPYRPDGLSFEQRQQLTSVTLPDNSQWTYDLNLKRIAFRATNRFRVSNYDPNSGGNVPGLCEMLDPGDNSDSHAADFSTNITTPDGLNTKYYFSLRYHGRSSVDPQPYWKNANAVGPPGVGAPVRYHYLARNLHCNVSFSLVTKEVSGFGIAKQTWRYHYSQNIGTYIPHPLVDLPQTGSSVSLPAHGQSRPSNVSDLKTIRTTTVSGPKGKVTYYIDREFQSPTESEILAEDYMNTAGTSLLKRVEHRKQQGVFVGRFWFIPSTEHGAPLEESLNKNQIQYRVNKTQLKTVTYHSDGNSEYYTDNSGYDDYGFSALTHEHNNFNGRNKHTKQDYWHDEGNWVLGLPTKTYVNDSGIFSTQDTPDVELVYHSQPNHPASTTKYPNWYLPYRYKSYGTWVRQYDSYNTTVAGAYGRLTRLSYNEPLRDAQGVIMPETLRYQQYSGYKRGQAQSITTSTRTGNGTMSFSRTVNNDGWVTSITDLNNNSSKYGYDNVGRLAWVDLPSPWLDHNIVWNQTTNSLSRVAERCILTVSGNSASCNAGTTKQTMTTSFDSLYRRKAEHQRDVINNIDRYMALEYDVYNNQTFSAYPSESPIINTNTAAGVRSQFDDLQRLISASSTGGGTVSHAYLSQNKIRVTDAGKNTLSGNNERHSTTTTYLAYGLPAYESATYIDAPENVDTTIDIDIYGNVRSINQGGITEVRTYDAQKYLCKINRPDVGISAFKNNVLGEVLWHAAGQSNSANNDQCSTAADSNTKVSFIYDNLGAQRFIEYENDPSARHTFTLDNNGNIRRIDGKGFTQTYRYTSLDALDEETLNIGNEKTFTLDYSYDGFGYLSAITYPDGLAPVEFAPNAFGEATQAIRDTGERFTFASNAKYHANGMLDSFSYGNGITHKTRLNSRQLPDCIRDYSGALPQCGTQESILNLEYSYDNNSNITSINNPRNGGIYSLTDLRYDGLNRLRTATGNSGSGTSTITYDALGNIKTYANTSSFDAQHLTYTYSNNRLSAVTGTGAEGYNFSRSDSYDLRGNVTHNGKRSFGYNLANQMTSSNNLQYVYDGYNRRIRAQKADGSLSYSMYSQSGQLLYRETKEGGINYIFLGKKLIAKEGTGVMPSGDSIMNYKPFGDSIEPAKDDVGFTGHKFDTDLDLSYMQARYFDPVIGRFYSNDPIESLGHDNIAHGFNRYAYANNNPYKYNDPTGEIPLVVVAIWVLKEVGGEVFEQTTGIPAPTVKNIAKYGMKKAMKQSIKNRKKIEGVYKFKEGDQEYIGQSKDVMKRVKQHASNKDKFAKDKAGTLETKEVKGGKFEREKAEQNKIDEATGGQGAKSDKVSNKVNPCRRRECN